MSAMSGKRPLEIGRKERGGHPVSHGIQAIDVVTMVANKSAKNQLFAMVYRTLPSHAVLNRHTRNRSAATC